MDAARGALEADPRIGYAILFGSAARGTSHATSDLDVAIGVARGHKLSALDLGDIASRLQAVCDRAVDVVDLESAPPSLAFRVFRDGLVLLERDRSQLVARKARAVLEYLDFLPVEELFARRVLAAAGRGR